MTIRHGLLGVCALLSACASSSDDIETAYVSPLVYKDYDCDQIASEMHRVSTRATQLGGTIDDNATGDAVAMGVGLILFWPALFFIDGDGPEAAEYSRLKGEYEALQQVSVQKKCGMQPATSIAAAPPPAPAAATPSASAVPVTALAEQPALPPAEAAAVAAIEPAAGEVATPPPAASTQQQAATSAVPLWRGEGANDGCSQPYSIAVAIDDARMVQGYLRRGSDTYLVNGRADPNGKLKDSMAPLSAASGTGTTPRYVYLSVDFGSWPAIGGFSTFDGKNFDCTTPFTLVRGEA